MNKKISITVGALIVGAGIFMIMPNTWIHLGSTVLRTPRPRVIAIPLTDISYVSCKKYEYKTIDHMDYKIYLSSSKKTYAVTTDTGKTIDVSSLINAEYFRQQKIALGQNDPTRMKYEISYTSDAITLKNKIFINDKEFVCPDVILPVPKDTNTSIATKVPPCNEVLYGLSEAEKEGVKCTGNYSLSIEKTIPGTQISHKPHSLISSLIQLVTPSIYAYTLIAPGNTYPYTTTEEPATTDVALMTAPPSNTNPPKKRRCENGVNINDYMNCKCPHGTYTYEQDDYTVVACSIEVGGDRPKKSTLWKKIKEGLNFGRVDLPADKDGQGGEGGWGVSGGWEF